MLDRVERFKTEVLAAFGSRAECLVLTGSQARGDTHAASDVDLWLFLDELSVPDLHRVGDIVKKSGTAPELNVQCATSREVASGAFREGFSPLQLHFGAQILHGELRLPSPSREDILAEAASLAAFVMMSCRHYIVGQESEAALAKGKLDHWVLKPLSWALRYEVLARTGTYPRELEELTEVAWSEEARELVRIFQQLRTSQFTSRYMPVVERAEATAKQLIRDIEERLSREAGLKDSL